jgi:hypothetical protein
VTAVIPRARIESDGLLPGPGPTLDPDDPVISGKRLIVVALGSVARLLPIPVDGAYLEIADGHALQGDGEVSCQAIECPMDLVDVTVHLLEEKPLANPRANTPSDWITFGFHEDLNEATVQALDGMLDLMGDLYGLNRVEAIARCLGLRHMLDTETVISPEWVEAGGLRARELYGDLLRRESAVRRCRARCWS